MNKMFNVASANSGYSFGYIVAESGNEALDLVAQDAGYESYKEACEVTGSDELVAEEVKIEEVIKDWIDQFMSELSKDGH